MYITTIYKYTELYLIRSFGILDHIPNFSFFRLNIVEYLHVPDVMEEMNYMSKAKQRGQLKLLIPSK